MWYTNKFKLLSYSGRKNAVSFRILQNLFTYYFLLFENKTFVSKQVDRYSYSRNNHTISHLMLYSWCLSLNYSKPLKDQNREFVTSQIHQIIDSRFCKLFPGITFAEYFFITVLNKPNETFWWREELHSF